MSNSIATNAGGASLHVSKLTRNVASEHLAEIFGTYGTVIRAEVQIDKRNGLSRGTATVVFSTVKEAENARTYLDGGQIDGSVISVADKIPQDGRIEGKISAQIEKINNKKQQQTNSGRVVETSAQGTRRRENATDEPTRRSRSRSVSHAPTGRTGDVRVGRSRERQPRGSSRSPTARVNSRDRFADRGAARGAAASRNGRQDSRDRGRGRGGGGGGNLSRYGPASGAPPNGRAGPAASAGVYGPGGGRDTDRGVRGGRDRPREGKYVPIDRSRGRSRSPAGRRPVTGRRSSPSRSRGRGDHATRRRSYSRSRSFSRGRRSPRRSHSRSVDSRSSASSGRRRRRSFSASSDGSVGARYRKRARSFSRSTRSYSRSRSPSRNRSVSRARSVSRSRSKSPSPPTRVSPSRSPSRN